MYLSIIQYTTGRTPYTAHCLAAETLLDPLLVVGRCVRCGREFGQLTDGAGMWLADVNYSWLKGTK